MISLLIAALVVGAGVAWRVRAGGIAERAYRAAHPPDAQGIAIGADSFTIEGSNGRALLLLHGSGDTPQTLRYLAERLNAVGYTVYAPLLPGHGRSPRAFTQVSAEGYLSAAREAL